MAQRGCSDSAATARVCNSALGENNGTSLLVVYSAFSGTETSDTSVRSRAVGAGVGTSGLINRTPAPVLLVEYSGATNGAGAAALSSLVICANGSMPAESVVTANG